jgi:hypothetical protein
VNFAVSQPVAAMPSTARNFTKLIILGATVELQLIDNQRNFHSEFISIIPQSGTGGKLLYLSIITSI